MRYFILIFSLYTCSNSYSQEAVWLLVDTQKKTLQVRQRDRILETFEHIAIGRKGANLKKRLGDDVTPIGNYKIAYTNNKSRFRKFFGINYPSTQDVSLALYSARISYPVYQSIMQAHKNNQVPPQNTVLGGRIGIHGVGKGDTEIHNEFDWTRGCVALSNQQIDMLAKWVYKGMRVQIK